MVPALAVPLTLFAERGAAQTPRTLSSGVLTVGLAGKGPLARFQADVASALAGRLGLDVRLAAAGPSDIRLEPLPVAPRTGEIAYMRAPLAVLGRRGLAPAPRTLADLRWWTLCAVRRSAAAQALRGLHPVAAPVLVPGWSRLAELLRTGRCDAVVGDAARLAALHDGRFLSRLRGPALRYVLDVPEASPLRPDVVAALRALSSSGELQRLAERRLGLDTRSLPLLPPGPRTTSVTLIGDSVAAALGWVRSAEPLLARGLRFRFEALSCRRLAATGCSNPPPPTALETLRQDGDRLGQVVVMDVGYNDSPTSYGPAIDQAMRTMLAHGVRHVVWLTLRERYVNYVGINKLIHAAQRRWPQLSVADWNSFSVGKPWFAKDGVHLNAEGATQLALFVRRSLAGV